MFAKTEKIKLGVDGMHCQHCRMRVENALKSVKGVKKVSVSLDDAQADIEIAAGKTDPATLIKAVEEAGFGASVK